MRPMEITFNTNGNKFDLFSFATAFLCCCHRHLIQTDFKCSSLHERTRENMSKTLLLLYVECNHLNWSNENEKKQRKYTFNLMFTRTFMEQTKLIEMDFVYLKLSKFMDFSRLLPQFYSFSPRLNIPIDCTHA